MSHPAPATAQAPRAPRPAAIQVLLVEDNPADVRLVETLLEESFGGGVRLRHVPRLAEAAGQLERCSYDVVLLDLSLPDGSGAATVRYLQARGSAVPIVVLTGLDDERTARQAMRYGAQDYLVKGEGDARLVARAIRYAMERKRAEQQLIQLAHYDALTGLANRALFRDRLCHALSRAQRGRAPVGLLFLDLDRFKAINDHFGHEFGDQLLKEAAQRLAGCVRESDTVARLGGDEFTLVLEGIQGRADAEAVARKVIEALRPPFRFEDNDVYVTISIGLALFPEAGRDVSTLIRNADTAMYRAKAQGRDTWRVWSREMGEESRAQLVVESRLRGALERGELSLCYQPRAELPCGRISAVEALLRWENPELGAVAPDAFIPLAEETGLIHSIGGWVLRSACRQGRAWQQQGLEPLRVAVNISAHQFRREGFVQEVAKALTESGMSARHLELEITESMLLEDTRRVRRTLAELKRMGLSISVDDFGTGYSSLSYLKRFPLDTLKIDRSFVQDIMVDEDDAAITRAIIALAHSLRLKVVAEGVETPEQLAYLCNRWCDGAQGNLIGRPVAAEAIPSQLVRDLPRTATPPPAAGSV